MLRRAASWHLLKFDVLIFRVGVEPVQEESEDVRLELMRLATLMCEAHPHDIGLASRPRGCFPKQCFFKTKF